MVRVSGFYMVTATNKINAIKETEQLFKDEISENIVKSFGQNKFKITDADEVIILDLSGKTKEYDTHFILELTDISELVEDSPLFYKLEQLLLTGIQIVEDI